MNASSPALSIVIPLYYSAATIRPLVKEIEELPIEGGLEIILVNDGSRDQTEAICRELVREARVPIVFINHTRNFGEHNAVLTGWRHATGDYIVNLDDDRQHLPAEALRLWLHAKGQSLDVVYGHYASKKHSFWRNAGSWFTNRVTDWALDKPAGLYLSSFRCVNAFTAKLVAQNAGPFPYVDGLILQVTQCIGEIEVQHLPRVAGHSGYTLRRLVRLWLSTFINFSVLPLRIATFVGTILGFAGLCGIGLVIYWRITGEGPGFGWGSLMAALLLFSGMQLVLLGVIGEYVGRMFLTVNQRPQSIVREVLRSAEEARPRVQPVPLDVIAIVPVARASASVAIP